MVVNMLTDELAENPFFESVLPEQIERLATLFTSASYAAGATIFRQGDLAERVYLLETGEVALRVHPEDGGSLTIARICPPGIFGWSAALGRTRYTSFAECTQDARALVAKGSDLRGLVQCEPELGRLVLGRMALAVAGRSDGAHTQLARLIQDEMAHAKPS
jgi:CRP-like cAMP-binding protein